MKTKTAGTLLVLLTVSTLLCTNASALSAHTGAYDTYNYSFEDGSELASADAYLPSVSITGNDLGVGAFSSPSDLFVDTKGGRVYLADTGNNRLVSTTMDFQDSRVFTGALNKSGQIDKFSGPTGICVASDGAIYVADTGNKRVVKMDAAGNELKVFGKPDSPQFEQGTDYLPKKVVVNDQGDIAVVCEGIYEGIVSIDQSGQFEGYLGMNLVKPDVWDLFWRMISTRKQLKSMKAFYPVTFNNIDLDDKGFIYATSQVTGSGTGSALQRLNPGGNNVLQNTSGLPLQGDLGNVNVGRSVGLSNFSDVCYLGQGIVACTDKVRSKIFLYSGDGDMLFAFGNTGGQFGDVTVPSGIDNDGFDLYVSDSGSNRIMVYKLTAYGNCILHGLTSYEAGQYDTSEKWYEEAFRYNTNSELAYLGIGKSQLRSSQYKEALVSFRLASNRVYYSKALSEYRREVFDANFTWIFGFAFLAILIVILRKPVWNRIRRKALAAIPGKVKPQSLLSARVGPVLESLDFANYSIFHPFKGFYELKYEKRGTMPGAVILLLLFSVVSMFRSTLTGYLFNTISLSHVNPLWEGAKSCLPILLFVVANWCITTLMSGEGNMKDIFKAACYALTPAVYGQILLIAVSNVIVSEESALYYVGSTLMYAWVACLLLVGNMSAHNFTMRRTVVAALATVLAMSVIIFILFLFFNLGFEVVGFLSDVYKEMLFRI